MDSVQYKKSSIWHTLNWIFWFIFFALGILNFIYIHPVPGIAYVVISLIYLPPLTTYFKIRFNFEIPSIIKVVLAFLVLWGTLAVGDLFELFEKNVL